jgi:hypothetical protein
MSLKFDYFDNNFFLADGYMVGGAHFSDNKDRYVFDYYVEGDKVVKIVLYTKNNVVILKQVYPTKDEAGSDGKK